jgi:hypothetical protein
MAPSSSTGAPSTTAPDVRDYIPARDRLLLCPVRPEAAGASRSRFSAVPCRPLRKRASARAWCPRSWRSSSVGVSGSASAELARCPARDALGSRSARTLGAGRIVKALVSQMMGLAWVETLPTDQPRTWRNSTRSTPTRPQGRGSTRRECPPPGPRSPTRRCAPERPRRLSRRGLLAVVDHPAPALEHPPDVPLPGGGISCATCANCGTPRPLARS